MSWFLLFSLALTLSSRGAATMLDSLSDIPLDSNGRVENHHLLFTEKCQPIHREFRREKGSRINKIISDELAEYIFGSPEACIVVIIMKGTPQDLIQYIFPENMISSKNSTEEIKSWLQFKEQVEIGNISIQ